MQVSKIVRHVLLTMRGLVPYLGDNFFEMSPGMALNFWLLETTGSSFFGLSATPCAAANPVLTAS